MNIERLNINVQDTGILEKLEVLLLNYIKTMDSRDNRFNHIVLKNS